MRIEPKGFLLSKKERIELLIDRDGDYCYICKKPFLQKEKRTIDHWIPLSRGGSWHVDNLRLAHKLCNTWKSDRMPNKDGTIPPPPVKEKRNRKSERPKVCQSCLSGRQLSYGEICSTCGSGPQPMDYPRWAKKHVKECDHKLYFCFGCTVGFIERKPFYRLENYGRI